jgi:hypothetical protein
MLGICFWREAPETAVWRGTLEVLNGRLICHERSFTVRILKISFAANSGDGFSGDFPVAGRHMSFVSGLHLKRNFLAV